MIAAPLTGDEVRRLPPLVDVTTAARALGIGRSLAYALAAGGEFPIPVLRIGPRTMRVRSAELRRLLQIEPLDGVTPPT